MPPVPIGGLRALTRDGNRIYLCSSAKRALSIQSCSYANRRGGKKTLFTWRFFFLKSRTQQSQARGQGNSCRLSSLCRRKLPQNYSTASVPAASVNVRTLFTRPTSELGVQHGLGGELARGMFHGWLAIMVSCRRSCFFFDWFQARAQTC